MPAYFVCRCAQGVLTSPDDAIIGYQGRLIPDLQHTASWMQPPPCMFGELTRSPVIPMTPAALADSLTSTIGIDLTALAAA